VIEPVAWMVTNDDGQDAYVTADPTLAQIGQRALPLYTLDRKDVLILDLYYRERELNREMRADALRLRWLAEDHADPEVRERVRSICQSIPTRSLSGVRLDIDAIMRA